MNFPGFDPSMLNNINVDQMKMASDMLSGMSDEQLRSYAQMMGMPNMDPSMLRQSAGMMKGMNQQQFDGVKSAAKNFKQPGTGASPTNNTYVPTSSTPTSSSNTAPTSTATSTKYSHIEKLKTKGNDFFKAQKYDDAASAYFEAVIEIEELRSRNTKLSDSELDNLEVSCRLNYANVKAKESDYDVVQSQAKKVLKIKENGKAYFRLGQAQMHFKKYEEALNNLEKAVNMLPDDDTIRDLRNKAREAIDSNIFNEKHHKEESPEKKSNKKEEKPKEVLKETQKNEESKPKEPVVIESKKEDENKPKMKKKAAPEVETIKKDESKPKREQEPTFDYMTATKGNEWTKKEEVKIEEERPQPQTTSYNAGTSSVNAGYDVGGRKIDKDHLKKGQEQLGSMSPDQLKMMTDSFKGMDNNMLKSMMKSQGMDVSDDQLNAMRNMMTPEMLQSFSKMDLSGIPNMGGMGNMGNFGNYSPPPPTQSNRETTVNSSRTDSSTPQVQQNAGGMPPNLANMGGMDAMSAMNNIDPNQIEMMLNMISQNPEMLKGMVGMLGENHPIAGFLKNKTPEQLAGYVKWMKRMLKVYTKVSPLIKFIRKYFQLLMGLLIGYIIYWMFLKEKKESNSG